MLRYGPPAPAFSLPSTSGRDISLSDFKGQADVVVLFYCYDWGGILTPELGDLGGVAAEVEEREPVILAISGDSSFSPGEIHRPHRPPCAPLRGVHPTAHG